jgi:hypothetical protein
MFRRGSACGPLKVPLRTTSRSACGTGVSPSEYDAGAILFLVGISPLGFDVMPNLLLAAALVYLLTQDFPRDAFTMLRDRRGRSTPTAVGNREPQGHSSLGS